MNMIFAVSFALLVLSESVLFGCVSARHMNHEHGYLHSKDSSEKGNDLLSFMTADELTRIFKKTNHQKDEDGGWRYVSNQSIKRSKGGHTENLCKPRDVLVSTYTFERGSQHPRTVKVKRCQGGINNPENYQCQPSMVQIKCFATTNDWDETDFIGTFEHTACEERCICNRKSCSGKKLYDLQCPVGYMEKKSNCQCVSQSGIPIFNRNLGFTMSWDRDLHKLCKKHGVDMKMNGGRSFSINN